MFSNNLYFKKLRKNNYFFYINIEKCEIYL